MRESDFKLTLNKKCGLLIDFNFWVVLGYDELLNVTQSGNVFNVVNNLMFLNNFTGNEASCIFICTEIMCPIKYFHFCGFANYNL